MMATIRTTLAFASKKRWLVYHMDVKSAFLNGGLGQKVWYKLKKDLYGVKQAPRAWNEKIAAFFWCKRFHELMLSSSPKVDYDDTFACTIRIW